MCKHDHITAQYSIEFSTVCRQAGAVYRRVLYHKPIKSGIIVSDDTYSEAGTAAAAAAAATACCTAAPVVGRSVDAAAHPGGRRLSPTDTGRRRLQSARRTVVCMA